MTSAPKAAPLGRAVAAAVGRADLLRAFAAGGKGALADMARLLGYEEVARAEHAAEQRVVAPAPTVESVEVAEERELAPVPFWRVEKVEHLAPMVVPSRRSVARIGVDGIGRLPGKRPIPPPLVAEAQLATALRRRLASWVPSRRVDVPRLVRSWSRGELSREIPLRPLSAWTPRVTVLVDRSTHLIPFWQDQDRLLHQLTLRLGRGAVEEVRYLEGFERPWRQGPRREKEPRFDAGTPVLALSDLGFLLGEERVRDWSELAARSLRAGISLNALVPCAGDRWRSATAKAWRALAWERPNRAEGAGRTSGEDERLDRAERLLALLSFAARVEPGLLRSVRRLLPLAEADSATEAEAWNHPDVAGGFSPAASLRPELRERLQARFRSEPAELRARVVETLRAWRAGEPREIWLDEVLALEANGDLPVGTLTPEEIQAAEELWRRLGETLEKPGSTPAFVLRALEGFVARSVTERIPHEAWQNDRWKPLLGRAWKNAWRGEGSPPLPAGVGPEVLSGARASEPTSWQIWQVGGELRFVAASEVEPSRLPAGAPLGVTESTDGRVLVQEGSRWAVPRRIEEGVAIPQGSEVVLRTDRTAVHLRRGSRVRRSDRPSWATAAGRDRYGLWAVLEVGGVEQRMRWIPPGRFWMGSPEDEPGRWDDEGSRRVETIEHGFWLGETSCTQALWEAVMGEGENPSEFKSPTRPVETVSWEDCGRFLEMLGWEEEAGEVWRLPSEKEWEYACRAGTETATYAGPIEILGEHKAPILNDIAWYGGNSGKDFDLEKGWDASGWDEKEFEFAKAGTRRVGEKLRNPWGLYDMLGNVFEWCDDAVDSRLTPNPEGQFRVIRGGSWDSYARNVRSAYRGGDAPSYRWDDVGFRLARGQVLRSSQGAEPQERAAERPVRGSTLRGTRRLVPRRLRR